jgi:hypothetical protein
MGGSISVFIGVGCPDLEGRQDRGRNQTLTNELFVKYLTKGEYELYAYTVDPHAMTIWPSIRHPGGESRFRRCYSLRTP